MNNQKIVEMEIANQKLMAIATPPSLTKEIVKTKPMGGPYIPKATGLTAKNTPANLKNLLLDIKSSNDYLTQTIENLNWGIDRLTSKPIAYPLSWRINVSSPFGARVDPIRHEWGEHQGVDFQAPIGAIILSSASGVVEKVGWEGAYGNSVLINHGEGYATRYAHASEILVTPGMKVGRQMPIAKVGNSGRSTGSHLHFEILKDGKSVNPGEWLVGMSR